MKEAKENSGQLIKEQDDATQTTISFKGASRQEQAKVTTEEETRNIAREIVHEELNKESKELRKDYLTIFGLFAGFLTFTVLQIQSLIQVTRVSLVVGISSFFAAITLTFVLGIHSVVQDKVQAKNFVHPVFIATILIFALSIECFWFAKHGGFWFFGNHPL